MLSFIQQEYLRDLEICRTRLFCGFDLSEIGVFGKVIVITIPPVAIISMEVGKKNTCVVWKVWHIQSLKILLAKIQLFSLLFLHLETIVASEEFPQKNITKRKNVFKVRRFESKESSWIGR